MSCASASCQVDSLQSSARQLPLLSPFLGLGGSLFKFAINLLDDITQDRHSGGEQTSDQQCFYGGLKN